MNEQQLPPAAGDTPGTTPAVIPDSKPAGPWVALGVLVVLWALLALLTWAHWGDPTVDCGREMYVASLIAQGKTLYKDVWYLYGPGAPYLNGLLFRLFGIHLNVLYIAGIVCVMLYALPLYWVALRMSSLPAAFCVALAVVIQSFHPRIFSFPMPYSFAAMYGAVCTSFFLLFVTGAGLHKRQAYVFGAGVCAALALLMKLEFGVACYATLGLLVLARYFQSLCLRALGRDLLVLLPGVLACALTICWMVSLGGVEFLTQENFMSWPTSYFMRTYGRHWLAITGFDLSARALLEGGVFVVLFLLSWAAAGKGIVHVVTHPEHRRTHILLAAGAALCVLPLGVFDREILMAGFRHAFLPLRVTAVVAGAIPLAAWGYWKSPSCSRRFNVLIVFCFAAALAFRHLFGLSLRDYGIYYNGPVYLAFFVLLMQLALPGRQGWPSGWQRRTTVLLFVPVCAAILSVGLAPYWRTEGGSAPLDTDRGTMYMSPGKAEAYREAIAFMREAHGRGESVMSMPEDTALYFFSGVPCPTRVFAFTPGLLAPGKMTNQVIREMETRPVRYLLVSNRRFIEYGAPEFGIDHDQPLGAQIRAHYRPVRDFAPQASANPAGAWKLSLWERLP